MKTTLLILGLSLLTLSFIQAQNRNLKTFKPEKNMVALEFMKSKADLKVKQKAYVQYPLHASVGIDGELVISDEKVMKIIQKYVTYDRAHTTGMTGDDSATVTLVLQVLQTGSTELNLKKIFRGQTESENKLTVTAK